MNRRLPRWSLALAGAVLAGALLASCKPWTAVPIEDANREAKGSAGGLDPQAYVASIWTAKVLPEAKASALDLREAPAGGSATPSPRFVRGEGVILRVDRTSRVGLALVDLAPGDGQADAAIQIGPVIRGMALRDALSFVRFSDFANQLEFADVGNALNARVLASVLDGREPAALEGRRVSFWGATRLDAASGGRLPEIVPVILEGDTP